MPDMNDYHAYKSTTGSSNGGGGFGFGGGCGCVVLVIVAIMLIYFIASGTSWEAIDTLLALGFLAFLFVRYML